MEQFHLDFLSNLAHLIKEDRSVGAAACKDSIVRTNRTGGCPFPVSKQFRLDECLRKFGEVDRNKTAHKAFGKLVGIRQIRDEPGTSDGTGSRSFAGAGFTKQKRRKILHAVPEMPLVPPNVIGKDAFPKPPAKLKHAR